MTIPRRMLSSACWFASRSAVGACCPMAPKHWWRCAICSRKGIARSSLPMEARSISRRQTAPSRADFPSPSKVANCATIFAGAAYPGALSDHECSSTFALIFGRVAQLAEHSTLNRQVGGSIPPASTNLNPSPSSRCRFRVVCSGSFIFQTLAENLAKLFSPVAFVNGFAQRLQLLMLIWFHRFQIGMPHGLADSEGVLAFRHGVRAIGVPRRVWNQFVIEIGPVACRLKALGDGGKMAALRPRRRRHPHRLWPHRPAWK